MEYELHIHPNWGMSRVYVKRYDDKESVMKAYDDIELGGVGGVVWAFVYEDGNVIAKKHYEEA